MSKLIRSTTVVRRPSGERRTQRPIYIIASGGEVFFGRRLPGAYVWIEADESLQREAVNDPLFNNPESH
jgi:hypothetical protein